MLNIGLFQNMRENDLGESLMPWTCFLIFRALSVVISNKLLMFLLNNVICIGDGKRVSLEFCSVVQPDYSQTSRQSVKTQRQIHTNVTAKVNTDCITKQSEAYELRPHHGIQLYY